MTARPLLFFDTGIGGLSVLAAARAILPRASIIYAADYAGLPYGEKSEAEIAARVPALLGRLVERFAPAIVTIACNTASTVALDHVRAALDVPVVGTVPAIKPAAALTSNRVIGVLGTEATVRQPYVDQLADKFAREMKIVRVGAPELVGEAEARLRGEPVDRKIIERSVAPLHDAHPVAPDVVVLACTHFPLLRTEIANALGDGVKLIDGAEGIARRVRYLLPEQAGTGTPSMRFVTTGPLENLSPYLPALEGTGFTRFEAL